MLVTSYGQRRPTQVERSTFRHFRCSVVAVLFLLARATCVVSLSQGSESHVETAICSKSLTGFHSCVQSSVVCYVGNFLVKMLAELNAGDAKSVSHVRSNLQPYLGGQQEIDLLPREQRDGLTQLRLRLNPSQLAAYDGLRVCHVQLTSRILTALPNNGTHLSPSVVYPDSPFSQVVALFTVLFTDKSYDAKSCPLQEQYT